MNQTLQKLREWMQKVWTIFKDEKKKNNLLVCMGLAGMLLLVLPEWIPQDTAAPTEKLNVQEVSDSEKEAMKLQERLQAMISQVEGAGDAEVMVTFSSGEEKVYATDQQNSEDGVSSVSHVLLEDGGLVETVRAPQIQGVAVVCEGGESAAVQNQIIELIEALTGVGASHITVAKMAASE